MRFGWSRSQNEVHPICFAQLHWSSVRYCSSLQTEVRDTNHKIEFILIIGTTALHQISYLVTKAHEISAAPLLTSNVKNILLSVVWATASMFSCCKQLCKLQPTLEKFGEYWKSHSLSQRFSTMQFYSAFPVIRYRVNIQCSVASTHTFPPVWQASARLLLYNVKHVGILTVSRGLSYTSCSLFTLLCSVCFSIYI